jgi:hypothetical protein
VKYSIDTSAILDGWRRYYPPSSFPGLWTKIEDLIQQGDLRATEEVLHELEKRDDEVLQWAKSQQGLFVPIDQAIQTEVSTVLSSFPKLIDTRQNRSAADPFVIALAKVEGCSVVTGEGPSGSANRPHIPDVCRATGIKSLRLLDLIVEEGWTFR